MVYPGRLSKGCQTCRKRKVKCDETRPTCTRCAKLGLECEGYRNLFEASIRYDNDKAEASALKGSEKRLQKAQAGKKTGLPLRRRAVPKRVPEADATDGMFEPLPLQHSPSQVPQLPQQAQRLFFDQFVMQEEEGGRIPGYLHFLPNILAQSSADSAVQLAATGVSLLLLNNQSHFPPALGIAHSAYIRGLRVINAALTDPTEAVKDSTLAAILLCCLYSNINGDRGGPVGVHGGGLHTLLRMRGREQFETDTGRALFNQAIRYLLLNALNQGADHASGIIDSSLRDWFSHQAPDKRLLVAEHKVCQIMVESNQVLSELGENNDPVTRLETLMARGRACNREFDNLQEGATAVWQYSKAQVLAQQGVSVDVGQDTSQVVHSVYLYRSIPIASLWNNFRGSRILLHQILLKCYHQLRFFYSDSPEQLERLNGFVSESVAIIREMVVDICASIPFTIGDIDNHGHLLVYQRRRALGGYTMLWALKMVIQSGYSTEAEVQRARKALRHVAYDMGVKQALNIAEV